jgi:hypothetical protein
VTSKEEFLDWKQNKVTRAVFSGLEARIERLVDEVVEQTATMSSSEMAEKTGAIKAIRDVLNIEFEETQND